MELKWISTSLLIVIMAFTIGNQGCPGESPQNSDEAQKAQQERILQEGTRALGMPAIKNFREKRLLKMILERRDQEGLITYTYMENMIPKVVPGYTARGGKLTYMGESIGYGLSCAVQYTNPQKIAASYSQGGFAILPQADPNGLFSPSSAEGTWVLMLNPTSKEVEPQYVEPRIVVLTYKLPFDQ